MRIFFLTLFCCSLLLPCFALAPITDANLTKAVNYGISGKQDNLTLRQFLQPWVIPEELQKNPFRRRESVVLYTPYLLAAIHARDQIAEQKLPDLAEIRENVAEYEGITLIGAVLNCPIMLEKEAFKVRLLQNEKAIEPYAVTFLAGSTIDTEEKTEKSAGTRQGRADVSGKTAEKPKVAVAKEQSPQLISKDKTAETTLPDMKKYAVLQLQFYFDQAQFIPTERYSISVADEYCGERRFDVDPAKLQ